MKFYEAYKKIVERSIERNTKEIPTILSCLDFENQNCLEIGAGPSARLAIKISGFAKHITCLENNKSAVNSIIELVESEGLNKRISSVYYEWDKKKQLPFGENSFDVVYGAWLPHKLATDPEFLDELIRVSKKHILLIMPGIDGDEPKLVSFERPGEKRRREGYKKKISSYLRKEGWKIDYKENILKLDFANKKEIGDVFYCLAFKNEPMKNKKGIDIFLDRRVHNFKDGFYCIHAERE